MGKLNIQGDLDISNYLTASNTNLYLSSASTNYSIRLRAGTTEFLRGQISTSANGTTHGTISGLYIFGPTYGNTAANIATAGKLSIGDPGPQIIFNCYANLSDGQPLALIYSDNDSIASGNSLSLVSSESNCTFIAPTIKALTKFVGALDGNASTATKLATARTISLTGSVTGSGTFDGSGNLSIATTTNHSHSYLPLSGGAMTGNISYANGSYTNYEMIKFITGTNDGAGIVIGGGGLAVFGCGESASNLVTAASLAGNTEETHITSDGAIYFHTNCQTIANRKTVSINASGVFSGTIAWGNVTGKPSSYTPASHSHSYVPLSGGSMSGQLSISINSSGTSPSTQHIILNGQNGSSAVANAPGLAMHIGNMNWSTLKFLSDGSWRFYNSGCNGYMPIYCSKTIVTNYGSSLPSSGATGEIFFKT